MDFINNYTCPSPGTLLLNPVPVETELIMKKLLLASSLVFTVLFANACTQDEETVQDPIAAEKSAKDKKHEFSVDKEGNVKFKAEIVYFKYDDYTLTEDGMNRLNALSSYMKKNKAQRLKIEGHCDDRGSVEYNLALGQLRAQSVKKYLATQGITDKRLATVSFGEEQPAIQGQGENAWSKNRRAEFKFVAAE